MIYATLYIHGKNFAYVYKIKIILKILQCHKTVRKHSKISTTQQVTDAKQMSPVR